MQYYKRTAMSIELSNHYNMQKAETKKNREWQNTKLTNKWEQYLFLTTLDVITLPKFQNSQFFLGSLSNQVNKVSGDWRIRILTALPIGENDVSYWIHMF